MKRILILEDNLEVLLVLIKQIKRIEKVSSEEIAVSVVSEGEKADFFKKDLEEDRFDVVLLDRYSRDQENFHQAVLNVINPKKAIAISSMPSANQIALEKGIEKGVEKDYANLELFGEKVKKAIEEILNLNQKNERERHKKE
ncbi:MAG: response regulator [Candidatus Moraniibacteriota bacterium]